MSLKVLLLFVVFCLIFSTQLLAEEIVHVVKKGESLAKIAKQYGVTEKELMEWNNLRSTKILVGQKLVIRKKKERSTGDTSREIVHIVKKGETLAKIAEKYGVTTKDLIEWNRLKTQTLSPGQKLVIRPKRAQETLNETERNRTGGKERDSSGRAKREREIIYKVKAGETLSDIAKLFGVSEEDIISTNNLKSRELKAGQRLLIRIPSQTKAENKTDVTKQAPKTFDSVWEEFNNIQREEERIRRGSPTRQDYLRLISEYRRIYLLYPASEVAPLALFKTAELYQEIYLKSLKKSDLLESAKRFELFLKNYPNHEKAENSYLRLLQIYRELKDEEKLKNLEREWGPRFSRIRDLMKSEVPREDRRQDRSGNRTQSEKAILADLKKVVKIEPITGTDYTRIIIDVTGNFEYKANVLPGGKETPPRIYVDIYPAILDEKVQKTIDLQNFHLERVRVGQFDRQTVRVVLDLKSLRDFKVFRIREPSQLVIDIHGKEKKQVTKEARSEWTPRAVAQQRERTKREETGKGERARAEKGEGYINLARQFGLGVRRIVIDPGHGGEDPGAVGPNGLREKDVVLKISKLVGRKLENRLGVEVIYTRTTDVFVPLVKRPALANSKKADLFVSIHLNASPDPNARGIETYYLNFTTDPEAMRVAAMENRVNDRGLADLQDLVKAILANTKLNESRLLAEKVQRELVRTLSSRYPDIIDRGVKYAPFLVLVGTRMPAILVEASFISNPTCAERLTREEYLELIAEGIARGIESYVQTLKLSGDHLGGRPFS